MEKEIYFKARNLHPAAPFHLPPSAQVVRGKVVLIVENSPMLPEIVLRDRRRDFTWQVAMSHEGDQCVAEITLPQEPTLVYYHFEFPDGTILREKRQHEGRNKAVFGEFEERDFQIAVYNPATMPAEWTQGMLIYQIFPDSFARGRPNVIRPEHGPYGNPLMMKEWHHDPELPPRGRDFYGGDLKGVVEKLDYLKAMGVNCIYFTPIFDSPTNHRYDANDFMKIDPMLGTEEEFGYLLRAAHARNIRVVLDGVFNHCSCDSIYFDMPGRHGGAYHNKQSPYYRWFNFIQWPEEYQTWWDVRNMPEFVECPEMEEFFLGPEGVAAYWLQKGVDGWRTDVTRCNSDTFWRRFRERVNEETLGAYLVSEEWEDSTHYLTGDMFSATMNYRFAWAIEGFFANGLLKASEFEDRLATLRRDTPMPALMAQMNLIDSHDTRRFLTACRGNKQRFMQAVAFQMSYPGAPMIYYGDEAGLMGETAEAGRKAFPWGAEDPEMLAFYQKITRVRQRLFPLRQGAYETLLVDDELHIHAFARWMDGRSVYAIYNTGNLPTRLELPLAEGESGQWADALEIHPPVTAVRGQLALDIKAHSMAWYAQI